MNVFIKSLLFSFYLAIACYLFGCNSVDKPSTHEVKDKEATMSIAEKAKQDAKNAMSRKDYRILVTSGRRRTAPGISVTLQDKAMEICGTNIISLVSDVIKNSAERTKRQLHYEYMQHYNVEIFPMCQLHLR